MKKMTALRLSDEATETLGKLSKVSGVTKTIILNRLIMGWGWDAVDIRRPRQKRGGNRKAHC